MPISFLCSCGKQLRAPEDYVGRRVKCPGCGEPQTVPTAEAPARAAPPRAAPPRAAAKPPAVPAGMVRFTCTCGKQMQARAEYAGRPTQCPGCGAEVLIPDAEEADNGAGSRIRASKPEPKRAGVAGRGRRDEEDYEDEEPSRRRGGRRDDPDEDEPRARKRGRDEEEDEEEPHPRKRRGRDEDEDDWDEPRGKRGRKSVKKKRALWPWLLAGSLALLLLVGGGLTAFFLWGGGSSSDMAYVPPDAQFFASVRVADAWKLPSTQKSLDALKPQLGGKDPVAEMQKETTLGPSDIERMTIVLKNSEQSLAWVVVLGVKAFDQKAILGKLQSPKTVKHEGKTIHVGNTSGGLGVGERAVYFASNRVLVFADEKGVKEAISSAARKQATGPLADAVKEAGGKHLIVVGFALPGALKMQLRNAGMAIPAPFQGVRALFELNGGTVIMNQSGDIAQVEATLKYATADKTKDARTALDGLKGALALLLPGLEGQMKGVFKPEDAKLLVDRLKEMLDNFSTEQKGVDLVVKFKINGAGLENIKPQFMVPGAGGPGMNPGMRPPVNPGFGPPGNPGMRPPVNPGFRPGGRR
jgi:hypothetical protein